MILIVGKAGEGVPPQGRAARGRGRAARGRRSGVPQEGADEDVVKKPQVEVEGSRRARRALRRKERGGVEEGQAEQDGAAHGQSSCSRGCGCNSNMQLGGLGGGF